MAGSEIKMKMSLDSSGVQAGVEKAKSQISGFALSSISKFKSIITSGLGPLGAAFGIAGVKKLIDNMTELGRTAERLGVGVESFQRLAFAAKQTGVDTERLADAMKDLDVKLTDGINRGGSFAELIQELGMDMNELAAMPADKRMLAFADAIQDASGSLSRFGADEFGDAMFELLPLLEMGSEGILKLGESAVTMSQQQIDAAERASQTIDSAVTNITAGLSIVVGELIKTFEFMVAGATQAAMELGNILAPIGKLLKGVFTADTDMIGSALNDMATAAEGSLHRVRAAMLDVVDEQIAEKHNAQQAKMTKAEIARLKKTADEKKAIAQVEQKATDKLASTQAKIDAEERKNLDGKLDTLGKLSEATAKRLKLEKELSEIDPFQDEQGRLDKKLELTKAIGEEQKLAADAQKEADENALQAAEEKKEAATQRLETELAVAQASGNEDAIRAAEERLQLESDIQSMVARTGLGYEDAKAKVEAINEQLKKEKDLQGQLVDAQADQNIGLQHELEKQIDLEQKIKSIMDSTNKGRAEAVDLAKKLQAIQAGPDLNQSGIVTRREQKQFDKQQQQKAKEAQQRLRDEERNERERGGNIPNVSDKKRNTGTVAERIAEAKEKATQRRENQAINQERDPEKRKKMIEAADKRVADVKAGLIPPGSDGTGGGNLTPKTSRLDKQKAKNQALADERETAKRLKGGENLEDIQKDIANRNKQGPNGGGGKGPEGGGGKEPKQPENPQEKANEKLDTQIQLLKDIKKALSC